jgi:hypothetical protein
MKDALKNPPADVPGDWPKVHIKAKAPNNFRSETMDRRSFLATAAAAGAAAVTLTPARVLGANNRVRVGIIGAGSRGQEDMRAVIGVPDVEFVAIADTYSRHRDEAKAIAPTPKFYDDPRKPPRPQRHRRRHRRHPALSPPKYFLDTSPQAKTSTAKRP